MIDNGIAGPDVRWYACALTIFAGVSMVSNVLFYSGKEINLRRSVPFIVIIAFVLGFLLVSSYPPGVLFGLFLCYAVSGYVLGLWNWLKGRKRVAAPASARGRRLAFSPDRPDRHRPAAGQRHAMPRCVPG
jgi:CDP-diacylglycerol--serine O-phosphatidyltransferase